MTEKRFFWNGEELTIIEGFQLAVIGFNKVDEGCYEIETSTRCWVDDKTLLEEGKRSITEDEAIELVFDKYGIDLGA